MAGKADRDWNTAAEAFHWFSEQSIRWISFENGVAVFFVVVVSLVCGLSSFYYLTSRKRVDFIIAYRYGGRSCSWSTMQTAS